MIASKLIAAGREYLLAQPGVTERILDDHLTSWRRQKKHTLGEIFRSMLEGAKNRGAMPNYIGDIANLESILFEFNPEQVVRSYSSWRDVCSAIRRRRLKLPASMDENNPRNCWVIYARAIISCAQFLAAFKSAEDFHKFVEGFYINEHSKLALPLLLEKELFGFGFALACDFLKENGYPEFVKPDTHIKDIARGVGITCAETDYAVFKDVVAYCTENKLVPYEFDKLQDIRETNRLAVRNAARTHFAIADGAVAGWPTLRLTSRGTFSIVNPINRSTTALRSPVSW